MQPLLSCEFDRGVAHIAHTTKADGDLSPSTVAPDELQRRRDSIVDMPWFAVRQVHSDRVVVAPEPGGNSERPFADALVTSSPGQVLAVHSGDCVPVGLIHSSGVVGAAHAGWKGLEAGVLESTVRLIRSLARASSTELIAAVGPHIRVQHYEFGATDLERLASRFGAHVVGVTNQGTPGLDLTAAIASELERLDVSVAVWSPDCTAEDSARYWSHRQRRETGRNALISWMEES